MNTLKKQIKRHLKFCFSYKGRLNRKAYFFSCLKLIGLALVYMLVFVLMLLLSKIFPIYLKIFPLLLVVLCVLGILIINVGMMSIQIKRLHDLNFSGWWFLVVTLITAPGNLASDTRINLPLPEPLRYILIAVDVVTIFLIGSFFFIKGSKGDNKYGKDPLEQPEA